MFAPPRRRLLVLPAVFAVAVALAPPPADAGVAAAPPSPGPGAARLADPPGDPDQPGQGDAGAGPTAPAWLADPAGDAARPGAGDAAEPAAGSSRPPSGVAAAATAAVEEDGTARVTVRLRDQVDLPALAGEAEAAGRAAAATSGRQGYGASPAAVAAAGRAARAGTVVDALQARAAATQPRVRALLAAAASDVREHWVFNGLTATVDAGTLAALADHPDVASVTLAEPVVMELPDPAEVGRPKLPTWSLESVNAPDVWGEYGVRGEGVVVGVVDTGVDGTHPALAGSWRGNHGDPAASWTVTNGQEGFPEPADDVGHGTHVTGSIVGGPPGEVVGVAPRAQWIATKTFADDGTGRAIAQPEWLHAAFEWMLAPGGDPANAPHVVNNSWSSPDGTSVEYWDAVAAWEAAGIVPVFSNGNTGPLPGTVGSPASYPHAIGVGATDDHDALAGLSSRGPAIWDGVAHAKPNLSAPGRDVLSSVPGGGYALATGTSMAAPHVAGAAALMLSADRDLTVAGVRAGLAATARLEPYRPAVPENRYGAGIVDAYAAVTWAAHSGTVTGTVAAGGPGADATVTVGGHTARTDPDTGRYTLRVPPGTHPFTVAQYGFATHRGQVVVAGAGATTTVDVALATAPSQEVAGTVRAAGGPVAGARVVLAGAPVPPAYTDQAGRFALTVAEGNYTLHAFAGHQAPATVPVTVAGPTTVPVTLAAGRPSDPGWAQHQNHPARAGTSSEPLIPDGLAPGWSVEPAGSVSFASPVIAGGRVFLGGTLGLAAYDLVDGSRQWEFREDGARSIHGAPAVAGGVVYTGGGASGGFHALDAATGEPLWSTPTPGRLTRFSTPTVVDGVVYAGTSDTRGRSDLVLALDAATGAEIWSAEVGERAVFGPAVADGVVVAASAGDARVVGLDAATGEELWSLERTADRPVGGASIAEGTVYLTTTVPANLGFLPGWRGSLLAVDLATGEPRWEVPTHGNGEGSTPAVHGDLVIAGSAGESAVAAYHRETGERVWQHQRRLALAPVSVGPTVTGDGYVLAAAQGERRVFALDAATGEQVWEHQLDGNTTGSVAYAEGRVVVVDQVPNTNNGGTTLSMFHRAGALTGTVTGPDGPLPARLRLRQAGVGLVAEGEADPRTGQFSFEGLTAGSYTVEASHFGFLTRTLPAQVVEQETASLEFVMAPAATGAIAGVVRDATGDPLAGATVRLPQTPLPAAVTGPDGGYLVPGVPAGDHQVVAEAGGHDPDRRTVTVAADATTTADFSLARWEVAVISDVDGAVTARLRDAGWAAGRITFDEAAGTLDRYRAVVVSGELADRADADPERFARLVAEADDTGTSLVFLGSFAIPTGSVLTLSETTGDPAEVGRERGQQSDVWMDEVVPHPVTASLAAGERTGVIDGARGWSWFSGYRGYRLARIGTELSGPLGGGIGYQPRTMSSTHVVLPMHAPLSGGTADRQWRPVMWQTLTDAVAYAATASFGTVTGLVTGADGTPLAGATVEMVSGVPHTTTGADGRYRLLLEPGEQVLRFRSPDREEVRLPVTVAAGATGEHDVALPAAGATGPGDGDGPATPPASIAFVPASLTQEAYLTLADVLRAEGHGVELVDSAELAALAGRVGEYDLVLLATAAGADPADLEAVLAAAEVAGVSVILGGQLDVSPVARLTTLRGDPERFLTRNLPFDTGADLVPTAAHPIFAGFPVGEPIPLLTRPGASVRASHYQGYSGATIAEVAERDGPRLGPTFGYRFTTPTSVELLLTTLTPNAGAAIGYPGVTWTDAAVQIYLNAVAWAATATRSEVAGQVTSAGEPLAGARVTVVETGARATTGPEGRYAIGLPAGDYTIEVAALGFDPVREPVRLTGTDPVTLNVDLPATPRGELTGVIRSASGDPVAGAEVRGTTGTEFGPVAWRTTTGADGTYRAGELLPGTYRVTVDAAAYQVETAEIAVPRGGPATLDFALTPVDVAVLGDAFGVLTGFLRDNGVSAREVAWSADLDPGRYRTLLVNGGDPDVSTFAAVLAAADAAAVSVVFTGTWGVDQGGIRLLERYTDRVSVAVHGYGDGPVRLTGHDPGHRLFTGIDTDPAELIVEGGYYSVLGRYDGAALADLRVDRDGGQDPVTGTAVGYQWRTPDSLEIVLSASAVTGTVGPGLGWTPAARRLLLNALAWAQEATLPRPDRPTVAPAAPVSVTATVAVSGTASWPATVQVRAAGQTVASAPVATDGTWSATVPLAIGDNRVTALAVNSAGASPVSEPVTVARWAPDWRVQTAGPTQGVRLHLAGAAPRPAPADTAVLVATGPDGEEITRQPLRWVVGFYRTTLRHLPPGTTLTAELTIDDHTLVIPHDGGS